MGIRIDSISRCEFGTHFSWHLRAKGFEGDGIYFSCWSGLDGAGLFARCDGRSAVELLASEVFSIHARSTADDVVKRIVTALVMLGWGPEYTDDPTSISGGRPLRCQVFQAASEEDLVRHPL